MYPTIMVVLVETRRSMVDICEIVPSNATKIAAAAASDDEAHPATLGHLSFAVGPINSAMNNEAEKESD